MAREEPANFDHAGTWLPCSTIGGHQSEDSELAKLDRSRLVRERPL